QTCTPCKACSPHPETARIPSLCGESGLLPDGYSLETKFYHKILYRQCLGWMAKKPIPAWFDVAGKLSPNTNPSVFRSTGILDSMPKAILGTTCRSGALEWLFEGRDSYGFHWVATKGTLHDWQNFPVGAHSSGGSVEQSKSTPGRRSP